MARKSRKSDCPQNNREQQSDTKIYRAFIYVRLSVLNNGKEDDSSIQNQIKICQNYIDSQSDTILVRIYYDNGKSGTDFDRPEFIKMMGALERKEADMVIVKDLSRLGRNFIDTQMYLAEIFPSMGVRFVAISNQFDSAKMEKDDMMIRLINLMNELYSKDISEKVTAALRVKMKEGVFRHGIVPYGYKWDEEKGEIAVNPDTSGYVKEIFRRRAQGQSCQKIADWLDEVNAPLPKKRKKRVVCEKNICNEKWDPSAISRILQNPVYLGNKVGGMYRKLLEENRKTRKTNSSEWFVFEGRVERLVSEEEFATASEMHRNASEHKKSQMKKTEKYRNKYQNLFQNKIFCADCKSKMYFRVHNNSKIHKDQYLATYYCHGHAVRPDLCESTHVIGQEILNKLVLNAVRSQIKIAIDYDALIKKWENTELRERTLNKIIVNEQSLKVCLAEKKKKLKELYEDYTDGVLSRDTYLSVKRLYEKERDELEKEIDAIGEKHRKYSEVFSSKNRWIIMMKSISGIKKLSQDIVDTCIEKVFVRADKSIELFMKYQDVFDLTKEIVGVMKKEGAA